MMTDKDLLLKPVKPVRNLADEVVKRITSEIRAGRIEAGAKLPTEYELMSAMGVSRTVVREAIAALKAEGLVTTRQGAGAFVAQDASRVPFRIDPDEMSTVEQILEVMELRLAVEVEAAALAAERGGAKHHTYIRKAVQDMATALKRGESAIDEDFAFHQAIAAATGNSRFSQFLMFLGQQLIPRQGIRTQIIFGDNAIEYLERLQAEHQRIAEAIIEGDAAEARRAMRVHLTKSIQRYRGVMAQAKG